MQVTQAPLSQGGTARRCDEQTRQQCIKLETPTEARGRFGEVTMAILEEAEDVIGASQRALDIAEHDIDPACTFLPRLRHGRRRRRSPYARVPQSAAVRKVPRPR